MSVPRRGYTLDELEELTLKKAHDVRHLAVCPHCDRLGDDRRMLLTEFGHMHGFCAVDVLGQARILALPETETRKLTLGATGPKLMRALIDRDARGAR